MELFLWNLKIKLAKTSFSIWVVQGVLGWEPVNCKSAHFDLKSHPPLYNRYLNWPTFHFQTAPKIPWFTLIFRFHLRNKLFKKKISTVKGSTLILKRPFRLTFNTILIKYFYIFDSSYFADIIGFCIILSVHAFKFWYHQ